MINKSHQKQLPYSSWTDPITDGNMNYEDPATDRRRVPPTGISVNDECTEVRVPAAEANKADDDASFDDALTHTKLRRKPAQYNRQCEVTENFLTADCS